MVDEATASYYEILIDEAEHRGYLSFNEQRTSITCLCGRKYTDDFTDDEEVVRAFIYSWLIIEKGYPANRMEVEYTVPRRTPSDRADIILFTDDARSDPYLVVEAKEPKCSERKWQQAIEQGFGNANAMRTTRYVLADRGKDSILFDIQNYPPTERVRNRLGSRDALSQNYGKARHFRLVAGTADDVRPFDPRTLETRVRRAHAAIWAGGKRDPLMAFDEWSKILFAKIWDERHTPNNEPRSLQISANETVAQTASRVRNRFKEARRGDPSIFSEDRINLPDDKIIEVIRLIEDVGFTLCPIDALGAAFEHFFGSVFRGDLGQYFTHRELARFVCGLLHPKDTDFVIDPTAGSGGFLLETLLQVWHYIDDHYAGQPNSEHRKIDFALRSLFGIEIHATLARVCKTNLLLHQDGHTNIEAERSCLDSSFSIPNLRADGTIFTLVVGNPPFGDEVKEGDNDRLGEGSLNDFELSRGLNQISSELVIIDRGLQFLIPGGRLGMVVPDGILNNSGEGSKCPAFRRFLLRNTKIEAVVSLPDHAFRKAGAQNKTSILFLRKFTKQERDNFDHDFNEYLREQSIEDDPDTEMEKQALEYASAQNSYRVFLAEVEHIGYTSTGILSSQNQLYSLSENGRIDYEDLETVLGQYELYMRDPEVYQSITSPSCHSVPITSILKAHPSFRLDPKFHLFELEQMRDMPEHMTEYRLGSLLERREEEVSPMDEPDQEFTTLTLSQEGALTSREAGKGRNPPAWYGAYFTDGSRWYRAYEGDLIYSQIDIWKGCVAVIPPGYDQAIVTQEFPLYKVDKTALDPEYLALLLRSAYFQRAIRAITTGHSNRRRTQSEDFEGLKVFLPSIETQKEIVRAVLGSRLDIRNAEQHLHGILSEVEEIILGRKDPAEFLAFTRNDSTQAISDSAR